MRDRHQILHHFLLGGDLLRVEHQQLTPMLAAQMFGDGKLFHDPPLVLQIRALRLGRPRRTVCYCRVSSQAQRPDLKNQRRIVEEFAIAKGIANLEFIEEIGGGLNFKRPKFTALVDSVVADEVAMLVVAHKDRLARFGFELLQHLCRKHGSELLVLNTEKVSPQQEMVQDLMAITDCFSSRLYGLRNYRRALKEALK